MMFLLVVTVSSMLLAAIMSVIAWRIAAEERRRSDARVATLAAEIHTPAAAAPRAVAAQASGGRRAEVGRGAEASRLASFPAARPTARWAEDLQLRPVDRAADGGAELFGVSGRARSGSRAGVVAAVGALVCVAAAAFVMIAGRPTAPAAAAVPAPVQPAPIAAAPAAPVPLELVALGHERDGDRLTVRGVVRNPESGAAVERLTAVVFAFDADGSFLASGRAIIESAALRPGGESSFVVTVPGAAAVGRYRVSFRSDQRVVPHVDRREPASVS